MRKWIIGTAAALAVVVVSGVVALKLLFPPDKLQALVVPQLESRIGRDVQLASVRLKVFPRIAVRLDDFAIANPPGFSSQPAVHVDALDLQVRLWPLVRKQVELGQLRLVRPTIRYEVHENGISNFQGLGGSGRSASAGATGGAQALGAAGFVVEDLVLREGTIYYRDRQNGRSARMGVDGHLSATRDPESGALRSDGVFDVVSIRALFDESGADSIAIPDLTVDYEAIVDLRGDSVALPLLEARVGEIPIAGSGTIRGLMGNRTIDLTLGSEDVDIAEIVGSLPSDLRPIDIDLSGSARLSLRANGRLGEGAIPEIDGSVELDGISIGYGELGRIVSDGSGVMDFDLASLSLAPFEAEVLGRRVELELDVSDFETLLIEGRLNGSFDLARIAELRENSQPMEGEAAVDLEFSGRGKDRTSLRLLGPIRLSKFSYQSESMAAPARIESASLRLTGTGLEADAIPVRIGDSDLTLSLTSRTVVLFALSGGKDDYLPFVEFIATSRRLDVGDLIVDTASVGYGGLVAARLAGRRLDGREPADIARERYADMALPPVNSSGHVEIAELINGPTVARDVSFDLAMDNGVLEIREVSGSVYGGRVAGGVVLDFSGGEPPFTMRYNFSLSAAQAGDFLQNWTRLGSATTGIVDFDIAGTSTVDESLLPAPDALSASGQATFREGRFQDFGLANALANQLRLDPSRMSGFQDFGGPFRIENGAFLVEDWAFSGSDLNGLLKGSAGLGGSLDLRLALEVPPSTLQKAGLVQGAGGLGDVIGQLAGGDEAIQVAFGVGGTMSNPALTLDTEALRAELAARLEDAGKSLLDRLLKKKEQPD